MLFLMQLSVPLEQLVIVGLFVCQFIFSKTKGCCSQHQLYCANIWCPWCFKSHVTSVCMQMRGRIGKLNEIYLEVEV